MKKNFRLYIGGFLALSYLATNMLLELDIYEILHDKMAGFETYELDELLVAVFIYFLFYLWDLQVERRRNTLSREKLKTYRAVISSTQYILNEHYNQVQVLIENANGSGHVSKETLADIDKVLFEMNTKIHALNDTKHIDKSTPQNQTVAPDAD